jgi:DNA-binding MarR family transcriptional regulator
MSVRRGNATQLQELIEEVIVTFRQLRTASAEMHGDGTPMPGQRGVLIDLARVGPQTAAGMAHARGVSRQHIQALVDRFRARGLVDLAENPAHRRSKLVGLTGKGRALVKAMLERERAALRSLDAAIPSAQIRTATAVLQALRQRLRDHPWERRKGSARLHQRGRK